MVCDILAGEQGPSCTSVDHIPNLRVVHIRFVETGATSQSFIETRPSKRKRSMETGSSSSTKSLLCYGQTKPE